MSALDVPAFLGRGLALLTHTGEHWSVRGYRTEADLRDALASLWWLHGAEVRTEVKVPNCGRIDILVETELATMVIELKKQILTPSAALAAFQQAHAYHAFLEAERPPYYLRTEAEQRRRLTAAVVACEVDAAAIAPASRAFAAIDWLEYGHAMAQATASRDQYLRRLTSRDDVLLRLSAVRHLAALLETAERDHIDLDETAALAALTDAPAAAVPDQSPLPEV